MPVALDLVSGLLASGIGLAEWGGFWPCLLSYVTCNGGFVRFIGRFVRRTAWACVSLVFRSLRIFGLFTSTYWMSCIYWFIIYLFK